MGKVLGFLSFDRQDFHKEPVEVRIRHWNEFVERLDDQAMKNQGARCMNCGIPFCHWMCPLGNVIPEWNDLVYRGCWKEALEWLHKSNNFPEITGRVCPALCENSCVLGISDKAVSIKNIELAIIEHGYREGWIAPNPPVARTGKKVGVIGSGPAGLACADQLNKAGHKVTVYEKNEFIGGLLVLGIPDFKLEPAIVERRLEILRKEGIVFKTNARVGARIDPHLLRAEHDALVLCGGTEQPRDLVVDGRPLQGVHFAVDYLAQQNRINRGILPQPDEQISAQGKKVVILGGGDTGADCVGTAIRQGAASVKQFELLPCPPKDRPADNPWPQWALIERSATSHEEGGSRDYCIMTKRLGGEGGMLKRLHAVRLEFGEPDPVSGRRPMTELPGTEFEEDVDMLILAMGFLGPEKRGLLESLGVEVDERGNVRTDEHYMTSEPGIFAAGDMRRGQSLVVWAIQEGRQAAEAVDAYLQPN
jgi:glutamate synthase (NADPH) small chain